MLKGIIPGPEQLTKKAIMAAVTIPEGIIMLTIAVFADAAGIILFILSLAGVGIPLSFLLDVVGILFLTWASTRHAFRGVISRATENIAGKVLNVGGGLEGAREFQGQGSSFPVQAGKKVAKTGIKLSFTIIAFIISAIVELIPFLGDIMPGWTFFVIRELIMGEL